MRDLSVLEAAVVVLIVCLIMRIAAKPGEKKPTEPDRGLRGALPFFAAVITVGVLLVLFFVFAKPF